MKTFFLVAMMTLIDAERGTRDIFVFNDEFKSWNECRNFSFINQLPIMQRLYYEFGPENPPYMLSCVEKEIVEKIRKELGQSV